MPQYTDVVDQARRDALGRLIAHAQSLGANAVIGVRFDSSDVGGSDAGLSEILAYGSAVVITPRDPRPSQLGRDHQIPASVII